ncbi:MAG: hypothetical protein IK997_07235 [Bacilli bacterium]|nr:hypothetical protein [Bacilli bacterium]
MPEINYAKEERAKLFAKKYFYEFITRDGKVNSNKNTENLYRVYLSYSDLYFNDNNEENSKKRFEIETAYNYLFYVLEEQKVFKPVGELVTSLLDSYDGLIRRISEYRFKQRKENGFGEKQNNNNDNILTELSSFKEILNITISNISAAMNEYDNKEKIDIYYIETKRRLEDLIKRIQTSSFELDKSKNSYHQIIDDITTSKITNRYINYTELSEAKKTWKKKRNEACYELIYLYKELDKLNEKTLMLAWITKQTDELYDYIEPTNDTLNDRLRKLRKSANYYCFLSESEKETMDKKNKEYKLKNKAINK